VKEVNILSSVEEPIFIVGPGRSGTTLLRTLLSAHPDIAIAPETHFMKSVNNWIASHNDNKNVELFWKEYSQSIRFADLDIDEERCYEVFQAKNERDFKNLFEAILQVYGEKTGKSVIGEKTPGHVFFIEELTRWFPGARFIALQRDPRAVVASQLRTPWVEAELNRMGLIIGTRLHQTAHYSRNWTMIYEITDAFQKDGFNILIVKYENLVSDTENELNNVMDFLGEEYTDALIYNEKRDNVHTPSGKNKHQTKDNWKDWREKHHSQSLRPISSESVDKWRINLFPREVFLVEGWCKTKMIDAGYTPEKKGLTLGAVLSSLTLRFGSIEDELRQRIKK
jgi:hypothetical protein